MNQKIFFIHGAGDTAQSSARYYAMEKYLKSLKPLSYFTHATYAASLESLLVQTESANHNSIFIGESFGGFWAAQLAAIKWANCILLNPVVYPAIQMQQFTGRLIQANGEPLSGALLKEYASAFDPRPRLKNRLILVLGKNDTVLDPELSCKYFHNIANLMIMTDDVHTVDKPESILKIAEAIFKIKSESFLKYLCRRVRDISLSSSVF